MTADAAHTKLKLSHGELAASPLHPVALTHACGPASLPSAALRLVEQALPQPRQQVSHPSLVIGTLCMYSNTINILVNVTHEAIDWTEMRC